MLEFCKKNQDNCVVLLKTDRVGDIVEGNHGIDFDLKLYSLICKNKDALKLDYKEQDKMSVQIFEVDRMDSIEVMINNLKEADNYDVIWRNEDYKDPDKIKSVVKRLGVKANVNIELIYSLRVSYQELQKYFTERPKPSSYKHDVFIKILKDIEEFDTIVANEYFPGDRAHIKDVHFDKDGIIFIFTTNSNDEINVTEKWYSWKEDKLDLENIERIHKKFEKSNTIFKDCRKIIKDNVEEKKI